MTVGGNIPGINFTQISSITVTLHCFQELDCSNNKITNLQGEHAEMEREVQLLSLSLKDMHAKFAHLNSDIQDVQVGISGRN